MIVEVTATSTNLEQLIRNGVAKVYDYSEIEEWRIKTEWTDNSFSINIKVPTWWTTIYVENIFEAISWEALEIVADQERSFNLKELSNFNLITDSGTQNIILTIA